MRAIIGLATMLMSGPVMAESEARQSAMKMCDAEHEFASVIMDKRQGNASLSAAMKITNDPGLRAIIIDAWERPGYATPEMQQKEVADFANTHYLKCIKRVEAEMAQYGIE